jgi:calcium-dependent protein kinase
MAQVKTGKLHNSYELMEELGSGSFGVVHKARDIRTNVVSMSTFVAVKTIPKKKVSDPNKIKEEFNVLRQLDHAHICKAYECYEDRRNIYLVMDICTGGTLLETLCKQTKFSEADASNVMRQILGALAYLHAASFVFRDLKTENIMFAKPVQKGLVGNIKLIDFGLCCPFQKGTKILRAAGTPYSVAPELVTAPVQYDQKCDTWSAGVVMYIILSGQYPFQGKTKDELLHNIRREPVSFKDKRWKKISKDAKTLLAEMLRKKAETRCEIIQALEHTWLQVGNVLPDANIMEDVVETMRNFQYLNMLQKAAITALAWRANDDDTKHLRQIFEALDRDGNGHITVQELRGAIESQGVQLPTDFNFSQLGTDGNETIEYTEFLAAALDQKKILKEEVIWEAFKVFDHDGSGTVTKKELLKILTGRTSDKIRQVHGEKAIEAFLDDYDTSGDDVIDFDEFMSMLGQGVAKQQGRDDSKQATKKNAGGGTMMEVPGKVMDSCMKLGIFAACTGKDAATSAKTAGSARAPASSARPDRRKTASKK